MTEPAEWVEVLRGSEADAHLAAGFLETAEIPAHVGTLSVQAQGLAGGATFGAPFLPLGNSFGQASVLVAPEHEARARSALASLQEHGSAPPERRPQLLFMTGLAFGLLATVLYLSPLF